MTAEQVEHLVHQQIGGQWNRSNLHHVILRECLVQPPRQMTFVDVASGKPVEAWLVLHTDPKQRLGYAVVYDELAGRFGLAQFAEGYEPCLIDLHGDLFTALEAM